LGLLLLLFWAGGCAVHPGHEPVIEQLPPSFSRPAPAPAPAPASHDRQGWWLVFEDPQLDRLVAEALGANPDIARAVARLRQLAAQSRVAEAGRFPYLNLQGQAGRVKQVGPGGPVTDNSLQMSVAAGFEIDLWQRVRSLSDAARAEALASREDAKTVYLSVSAGVVDLYFLLRDLGARLELADQIILLLEEGVAVADGRYRAGLVTAAELYQAQQELSRARLARAELAGQRDATEHALAILAGRFPTPGLAGELGPVPELPVLFPLGLPADLLTRRPDVQAARLRVTAQDERLGAALAERFPTINLMAGYGATWEPLSETFWSLLAGLTQPVFDGGRRQAAVEQNRAALDGALAAYRQTVLQAVREVEDALAANRRGEQQLAIVRQQLEVAEAALALARDGYGQGMIDYAALLTARRQGLEIRQQVQLVARQLLAERTSLIRALGGEWMEEALQTRLGRNDRSSSNGE